MIHVAEETKKATADDTAAKPEGATKAQAPESDAPKKDVQVSGKPPRKGGFRKNTRRPRKRRERVKPEFDHRVIDIRRVTRVVAGGRRFSFSTTVLVGNHKGKVGVGIGKSGDTALAIEKGMRDAKKHIIEIARTKTGSIAHQVQAKYASADVLIFPTPGKGGLSAGSAVRTLLELGGMKDVGAKLLSRTKNKLNIARAAVKALEMLPQTASTKKENPNPATAGRTSPKASQDDARTGNPKPRSKASVGQGKKKEEKTK